MTTLTYFTLSFALTLWLSRFLLRYLDPTYFMDHPTERKIHDTPLPRFGGMAFAPVIILLGWLLLNGSGEYSWYFLGALAIFVLGAVDDYWSLSWKYKLPIQMGVGLLVSVQFISRITQVDFFGMHFISQPVLLVLVFLFWFIGILNALNLIDGMDGLAGGFVFLVSFGAIILGGVADTPVFVAINAIVMGAIIAFLHFNQRPAQFFMGDSGSLFLGYHVATLPLLFALNNPAHTGTVDITPFVLFASYLIVDTIRVFYLRLSNHRHPLEPDQSHLHHVMLKASKSYNGTLLSIFILLAFSGIGAVIYAVRGFGIVAMVGYLLLLMVLIFYKNSMNNFVRLVARLVRVVNHNQTEFRPLEKLLRIRYLPFICFIYFLGLILNVYPLAFETSSYTMLAVSSAIIILYIFIGTNPVHKSEILVIGLGIIHAILISIIYAQGTDPQVTVVSLWGQYIRYFSLTAISVVALTNYVLFARKIPSEYWSATDLLVLFILIGLASIQSLGIGISPLMAFELGILYFSNKLYIPRLFSYANQPAVSVPE